LYKFETSIIFLRGINRLVWTIKNVYCEVRPEF
jgi:hypothetical protein